MSWVVDRFANFFLGLIIHYSYHYINSYIIQKPRFYYVSIEFIRLILAWENYNKKTSDWIYMYNPVDICWEFCIQFS